MTCEKRRGFINTAYCIVHEGVHCAGKVLETLPFKTLCGPNHVALLREPCFLLLLKLALRRCHTDLTVPNSLYSTAAVPSTLVQRD